MKQIIYILLTTTVLGLMSCSDWLDVSPKTSIPTDKQFESESGFKDALTGIYLKLGTKTLYAGDLTYAYLDELAGLYSDYPGYNTNAVFNQSIVFDYENMFLSKKNGIYSTMYNIIANINNFLEYVDKNKDVLVTERYYETMKGEALGLRAFLHFDLLRMFGPVYKEHPASKAIPYRTAFDKDATPVLSASEVVDAILKDLNDAEKLLKGSDPLDFFTDQTDEDFIDKNHFLVNREFRMNLYAVKAMLARVYCYKGDAESKGLATEYAKQVIAASKYFTLYKSQTASNYNSIRYAEQIFGITTKKSGKITLDGNEVKNRNPHESIKNGFALLTEERRATGIFGILNIRENTTISSLKKYQTGPFLNKKKMKDTTDEYIKSLRVKTPNQETKISSLSGGNQQKVILARWLLTDPTVLLLDEPTRGIDVGAKYEIYQLILDLAKKGKTVIMVSSEMAELLGVCDKILVMSGGRLSGEVDAKTTNQEEIMTLAAKYV